MNRIGGKVTHKESGLGIPDLLVVIYDVDPHSEPEEILGDDVSLSHAVGSTPVGDRLCSLATDGEGMFAWEYEDTEFQHRSESEKRPDLLLTVVAPEETDQDPERRLLHTSVAIRQNAGRLETFLIRLTSDQLTRAGVSLPTQQHEDSESSTSLLTRFVESNSREEELAKGIRELARKRVEKARDDLAPFETTFRPQLRTRLSRLSEARLDPHRVVLPGESVGAKSDAAISIGIAEVVNDPQRRAQTKTRINLTDAQVAQLRNLVDSNGAVDDADLRSVLADTLAPATSMLVREEPWLQLCRDISEGEKQCIRLVVEEPTQPVPTAQPQPTTPIDVEPVSSPAALTTSHVRQHLAHLMATLTTPEEAVVNGLTPRATRVDVQEQIQELSFATSPADTPSYHDFHNLQIAFEHVWQEVIDEGILDLAQDAYQAIVALGGVPDATARAPEKALAHEGTLVMRSIRDHRKGGSGSASWQPSGDEPPPSRGRPRHDEADLSLFERLPRMLRELEQRMKENYNFTVYAANERERSINFGLMVTYRQKWSPESYQAGELVKTLTLAPRQTQKVSVTKRTHTKRYQQEVENNVRSWREESSSTSRADEEITRRASIKTNFDLTTKHTFGVKVPVIGDTDNSITTAFGREANQSSDAIKRSFHEAVMQAASEYKNERTTEVSTESTEDFEMVESTEITNPNDELAVTFLFYELQRRYRVTEAIHRLVPVVMVAQEVPNPHDIDADWLLTHDWILRRVMLDDSFIPALDVLISDAAGEEVRVEQLKLAANEQHDRVEDLKAQERSIQDSLKQLREFERLLTSSSVYDRVAATRHRLHSRFGADKDKVADAIREADGGLTALRLRREQEAAALASAVGAYNKSFADAANRATQIARLRVHVKQNILYYMQAIWSHEPPDQRFFRLHNTKVPTLKPTRRKLHIDLDNPLAGSLVTMAHRTLPKYSSSPTHTYGVEVKPTVDPTFESVPLSRAADLDTLLGFKGNYMIFALKESNALTDMMMDPYVDRAFNALIDPDDIGNLTLEEFAKYVCCLHEELTEDEFAAIRPLLNEQHRQLLAAPRRGDDMVIIPSGSLFIEALPAKYSVVEEFKARHRAVDVKKVQAEVRRAELENIRYAARILGDELEDPDVDKRIVIHGNSDIVTPADL